MNQQGISPIGFALGVSMAGLSVFTAVVLGVFSPSTQKIVTKTLESDKLKNTTYAIVLPKNMFDDAEGAAFLRRFKGATNQLYVCSVSARQFTSLSAMEDIKITTEGTHQVIWFDGNENSAQLFGIVSRTDQQDKCVGAETSTPFYIDGPKTISSIGGGRA